MKYILILIVLIVSNLFQKHIACAQKTRQATHSSNYTIIKFNPDEHYIYFDGHVKSATLSSTELSIINAKIAEKAQQYNNERKDFAKKQAEKYRNKQPAYQLEDYVDLIGPIKNYYKQIVVVINRSGEKEAFVNCFCSKPNNESWKKNIGLVEDGGNCYFQLKINLTDGRVVGFSVNGSG